MFCVRVSQAARHTPRDIRKKCEVHFGLVEEARQGSRVARRQLDVHDQCKSARP